MNSISEDKIDVDKNEESKIMETMNENESIFTEPINDITKEIIDSTVSERISEEKCSSSLFNSSVSGTTSELGENQVCFNKNAQSNSAQCPECFSPASLSQYSKSSFKPKNRSQVCWIYRMKCSNIKCNNWFGPLKRFDRNSFIFVDEDGRPLGRHQRSASSFLNHEKDDRKEKEKVEVEKNDNESSEMNIETNEDYLQENNPPETEKKEIVPQSEEGTEKKKKRISRRKPWTSKKVSKTEKKKNNDTSKVVAIKAPRRTPGYVYIVEPIHENEQSTSTESEATQRIRKCRSDQEQKTKNESKITKEHTLLEFMKKRNSKLGNKLESKKTNNNTKDAFAQTGNEELIKSLFIEDLFNNVIQEECEESISVRLLQQPLFLRKHYVMLFKTNKEQKKLNDSLKKSVDEYIVSIAKIKEGIKKMKWIYGENMRRTRDDAQATKNDFQRYHYFVNSMIKSIEEKYLKLEKQKQTEVDNVKLKMANMEALLELKKQEIKYEQERAEYYLRLKDTFEQRKNEAKLVAKDAEEKLNDALYLKDNQKCAHCQINEKLRKKLTSEVADVTESMNKAIIEKNEYDMRMQKAERCAQILIKEVDKLNYETRTWKSQVEKLKEQLKDAQISNETTTPAYKGYVLTPKSVTCTPSRAEMERETPEEGQIIETSSPIDDRFSNWVPREKLSTSETVISPFGIPMKKEEIKQLVTPILVNSHKRGKEEDIIEENIVHKKSKPNQESIKNEVLKNGSTLTNKKFYEKSKLNRSSTMNNSFSPGYGSLSNFKKIPKKSNKPPPHELESAVGLKITNKNCDEIPGSSSPNAEASIDDVPKKIYPPVVEKKYPLKHKKSGQSSKQRKKKGKGKNSGNNQHSRQYGIIRNETRRSISPLNNPFGIKPSSLMNPDTIKLLPNDGGVNQNGSSLFQPSIQQHQTQQQKFLVWQEQPRMENQYSLSDERSFGYQTWHRDSDPPPLNREIRTGGSLDVEPRREESWGSVPERNDDWWGGSGPGYWPRDNSDPSPWVHDWGNKRRTFWE